MFSIEFLYYDTILLLIQTEEITIDDEDDDEIVLVDGTEKVKIKGVKKTFTAT
jgi:hypothetical protein